MNVTFKMLSVNAREMRSLEKRKAVFGWLIRQGVDICFLQETCSTKEVEKVWKTQWQGDMFFSHGTVHSRGVLILVKNELEFKLNHVRQDSQGRFIVLDAIVQGQRFILTNIYAPNKTEEQIVFFDQINDELDIVLTDDNCNTHFFCGYF